MKDLYVSSVTFKRVKYEGYSTVTTDDMERDIEYCFRDMENNRIMMIPAEEMNECVYLCRF